MKTIVVTRTIQAPIERVFDQLTDLANYTAFPGVRRTRFVKEGLQEKNGVGAIREVDAGVFWLQEEIVGFERPFRMDYRIRQSRPRIRHESGRMQLRQIADGTEVTWTSTFTVPLPLVGRIAEGVGGKLSELMFTAILHDIDRQLTR
jgi:uncharacterized protein YndB with AHSA1/START domain